MTKRCIQSIPDRDDIQIVIVDDNSSVPNRLKSVESELRRNNATFIYTVEGRGAGYARNVGIENAVGKWLIFADADDFFTEDAFNVFDKYKESDNDIVYFFHTSVYSDTLEPCLRYESRNEYLCAYLKRPSRQEARKTSYLNLVKSFRSLTNMPIT